MMKLKALVLVGVIFGSFALGAEGQTEPTTFAEFDANSKTMSDSADNSMKKIQSYSSSPTTCPEGLKKAPFKNREDNAHPEDENIGSAAFKQCYYLSLGQMRDFYDKNGKKSSGSWEKALGECIDDDKIKHQMAICDAAAFIISTSELGWELDPDAATQTVKSSNGEMKCSSSGVQTLDYEPCVKFIKNHDLLEAAQQTIQTGQNIYYQEKTMEAQVDAAKSTDTGKAALIAQHGSVKAQQGLMNQRATLDTGKLMTLLSLYKDIPSYEDLDVACKKYELIVTDSVLKEGCKNAIKPTAQFGFLMNQSVKDKMKARLIQIGLEAGSNLAIGNLLSKRASDISKIIAKVDSFKPIDPLAPSADNLQSTFCQQNPGDTKCLTGGLERTFDAMGDNVITFGETGSGVSFNNTNPYIDPTAGTTSGGSTKSTTGKSVTPVGSVVASADNKGGLQNVAPKAALGEGSGPGGGGGGGGGGLGGGGGGGSGAPVGQQAQGGVSAAIQGKTPSYGGGSGTLSMMGGFGINKAKSTAKDDSNPFGKLFNKEASKNGTLSFGRDPASQRVGDKGDNIFDMISKRYSSVSTDKRLLEYELAK